MVQQTAWQSHDDTATLTADGVYRLVFLWHSDQRTYANPAPAIDNIWLYSHTPMGDTVGVVLGSDTVHYGDSVTLTAVSATGYHFKQWGDGDTSNPRRVQAVSDSLFHAVFSPDHYELLLNVDSVIHGTVSGAGHYYCHEARTIYATANYGYHFTAWSDGNTSNPRTIILSCDTVLTAFFDRNGYSVVVQPANTDMGYTHGSDTVLYLDSVTISATSYYGYHFTQWSDGMSSNPRSLRVTGDTTFTAQFDYNQYTITLASNIAAGYDELFGAGTYNYLSLRTIMATPSYGYHFTVWSDSITDNPRTITLTQDTALTALFDINQYQLSLMANDPTLGSVTGSGTYPHGTTVTITAIPAEGKRFDRWSDNTLFASRTITLTGDLQLVAVFVPLDTMYVHDTTIVHDTSYVDVHDTTYIDVHDTTYIDVHDTTYIDVHDTTYINVHDTTYINVHDTTYIDVPYAVHDTTFIDIHDTTFIDVPYAVHDTTVMTDTVTMTEYVPVHDTTYIDVHDTTYIDVPYAVHDTTVVIDTVTLTEYVPVHDTTYIDVHDTTYIDVHDTTYIDVPYTVHDTTVVIDTVTLTEYVPVHDTTYIDVHDTTYIDVPYAVHDTTVVTDTVTLTQYDTITNTVYDTIDNFVYDTLTITDTLWLTMTDTLWLTDTIIIYDTVYITEEGVDGVDALNAKVYSSQGQIVVEGAEGNMVTLYDINGRALATKRDDYTTLRFDAPASGTYMIKIGRLPAHKVVVIR